MLHHIMIHSMTTIKTDRIPGIASERARPYGPETGTGFVIEAVKEKRKAPASTGFRECCGI
jgi:hypothetical protein